MDGSIGDARPTRASEGRAFRRIGQRTDSTPDAVDSRKSYASAIQITLLAGIVICDTWLRHKVSFSAQQFAFGILIVCGFAIQTQTWTQSVPLRVLPLAKEASQRSLQAAGLVMVLAVLFGQASDGAWQAFDLVGIVVSVVFVAAAGVFLPPLLYWRRRASKAPRVMIFGLPSDAKLDDQLGEVKLYFYPASASLPQRVVDPAGGFYTDPHLIEHAPEVAIVVGDNATVQRSCALLAPLPIDVLVQVGSSDSSFCGPVVRLGSRAFIRVFPKPLGVSQRMLKRAFDILGSAFLVCVLFPVLLALAVLVKVSSPGPIFFRQSRTGFRGEPFVMFKFRTMRVDAQDVLGVKATTRDDPRVTRIGAFLRRSSLDELPQLFNVLWGSMSLVGPRPHAMNSSHFRAEIDNYDARHRVKPGVTGLAQVLGWRGLVSTPQEIEQRVANDLQYISSWTFAKDIQILMQTVIAVFSRKNAF